MAKETFYFSHDYNARSDAKIKLLLKKYGMAGYGIYWSIIEDLYNNANALPTHYESIAYDLRTQVDKVKSIVENFGLFVIDGDFFGSLSVQKRLQERDVKSKKASDSAKKRWTVNANALPTQCEPNAIKESKGKEKKVKERKGNIDFIPPSLEEFKKYFELNGFTEALAIRAWTGYEEAKPKWTDSQGKKIRSWKTKCQQVWFKDENKAKVTKQKPEIFY